MKTAQYSPGDIVKKFCGDCNAFLPVTKFSGTVKYSSYCRHHMNERSKASQRKKKAERLAKRPSFLIPATIAPKHLPALKWPRLSPCGERATCRDCGKEWAVKRFNLQGKVRKDGTKKRRPDCCYCQASKRAKRALIIEHRKREEERETA
jgi:hypothetical protein